MKSLKQLEKEIEKQKQVLGEVKFKVENLEKSYLQDKACEKTKTELCEAILEKREAEQKVFELEFVAERVYELKKVREEVFKIAFLTLQESETEKLKVTIDSAIDRWLSKK